MERILSTQQIFFCFIYFVCMKYYEKMPFGNSGKISSAAMVQEQFHKKQNILLEYDRIYVNIYILNG